MVNCCDITSASLNTLIKIERRVSTSDGQGGWTEEWVADPPSGVWANVTENGGVERLFADRIESLFMTYFIVRFRGDAMGAPYWQAPDTRIILRGRTYNVQAIFDIEQKKKWLRFMARMGEVP